VLATCKNTLAQPRGRSVNDRDWSRATNKPKWRK